jgi:hypothetical protein
VEIIFNTIYTLLAVPLVIAILWNPPLGIVATLVVFVVIVAVNAFVFPLKEASSPGQPSEVKKDQ